MVAAALEGQPLEAVMRGQTDDVAVGENDPLPVIEVSPVAVDRSAFAPEEQVMAAFLLCVGAMANDVVMNDEDGPIGFFGGGWWREPSEPFNARVQEQVATLSWFYSNERSWNPYYLDQSLLTRLDAGIAHYLGLQHADGTFPEYRPDEHSRPATAFALGALAETLENLKDADALPATRENLASGLRRACDAVLDDSDAAWSAPIVAANQAIAALAGAARASAVLEDPALLERVRARIPALEAGAQAPAGFLHEPLGFDYGYNLYVAMPDLADLFLRTGDHRVLSIAQRWTDFFGYSSLLEPDGSGFSMYSSMSSRGGATGLNRFLPDDRDKAGYVAALVPHVPELAAYRPTREEKDEYRRCWGSGAGNSSPSPDCSAEHMSLSPRRKLDTDPRLWMHVLRMPADATAEQRKNSEASLPYIASSAFTEFRTGTLDQHYLFIRRRSYYAAAMYGVPSSALNRLGPGHLWNPDIGTLISSLNVRGAPEWGTRTRVDEGALPEATRATYHVGASSKAGSTDGRMLAEVVGPLHVESVGELTGTRSSIQFWDDGVTVRVDGLAGDPFTVPLVLMPDDELSFTGGEQAAYGVSVTTVASGLSLRRNGTSTHFGWGSPQIVELADVGPAIFEDGRRRVHRMTIGTGGPLAFEVAIADLRSVRAHQPALSVSASSPHLGSGEIGVRVTNMDDEMADIIVSSVFGEDRYPRVAPGASVQSVFVVDSGGSSTAEVAVAGSTTRYGRPSYIRTVHSVAI